ncbi:MAG: tol-pal system-associated acyl-CoA thioesterase [Magnetococcales bacterium]|nr:tol-pal system-associated acyl-CoA thioesterase [Magnetococcales bacterium]NGZ25637.1 tol-pal system-associated acyl-CoA thioesterase [Magnetococcales bacterium]
MNTFHWPIRIYYEDTDGGGVVYHSRYLNFFERARTEWLRQLGINQEQYFLETGLRFAVSTMEIRFLAPAVLDDLLTATVTISRQGHASLHFHQELLREGKVLITAEVRIACVNAAFRPSRLPVSLTDLIHTCQLTLLETWKQKSTPPSIPTVYPVPE